MTGKARFRGPSLPSSLQLKRTDNEDRDGPRNAGLLAIQPPDAAACPRTWYYFSFALLHFSTEEYMRLR
jgi:hypothetical protein